MRAHTSLIRDRLVSKENPFKKNKKNEKQWGGGGEITGKKFLKTAQRETLQKDTATTPGND